MAQNFWTAIFAWSSCFLVTIVVSLIDRRPARSDLGGLVYSETPRLDDAQEPWHRRPKVLGLLALAAVLALNLLFW
jgi:SSS family solute:Na+ symporter